MHIHTYKHTHQICTSVCVCLCIFIAQEYVHCMCVNSNQIGKYLKHDLCIYIANSRSTIEKKQKTVTANFQHVSSLRRAAVRASRVAQLNKKKKNKNTVIN